VDTVCLKKSSKCTVFWIFGYIIINENPPTGVHILLVFQVFLVFLVFLIGSPLSRKSNIICKLILKRDEHVRYDYSHKLQESTREQTNCFSRAFSSLHVDVVSYCNAIY
jgi:hypothetical protein